MSPEENKKEIPTNFGKVIDILHNKSKLPSLRTYQGDMAEFIKEKNESVISVAVKEKEREERREEKKEEKKQEEIKIGQPQTEDQPKPKTSNFQINFTLAFLSIFLLVGGVVTIFYIYSYITNRPDQQIEINNTNIIPYNNAITLANISKENLGEELVKLSPSSGVNIANISDQSGRLITDSQNLLNFLEVPNTITLRRTLTNDFALGTISQNETLSLFLIITVDDFGRAFASMLDWEEGILGDLNFLVIKDEIPTQDTFLWKDLIIKNKDTRALIDNNGNAKIAYTFLDKNTILITGNIFVIGEISDLYHSRAVAR